MKDRLLSKAIRVDSGEWIVGYYCECFLCYQQGSYSEFCDDRWKQFKDAKQGVISNNKTSGVKVLTDTVCQCTGTRDINNNLIFENDIIKVPGDYYGDTYFASVSREVVYDVSNGSWDVMAPQFNNFSECEIIGNKYDQKAC
jgi:hypothetical protein